MGVVGGFWRVWWLRDFRLARQLQSEWKGGSSGQCQRQPAGRTSQKCLTDLSRSTLAAQLDPSPGGVQNDRSENVHTDDACTRFVDRAIIYHSLAMLYITLLYTSHCISCNTPSASCCSQPVTPAMAIHPNNPQNPEAA